MPYRISKTYTIFEEHLGAMIFATGLSDEEGVNSVRPKRNRYKKNAKTKRHKKSKQSNIKYFLTIYFLTETTQKWTNFVNTLLSLYF